MKKINVGDYVMVVFDYCGVITREVAKVLTVTDRNVVVLVDGRKRWYRLEDVMPWYS
tara:strand:+ start:2720 stop:2890 length:171 start_codon:yes stop_codon:yes gene_type:complete